MTEPLSYYFALLVFLLRRSNADRTTILDAGDLSKKGAIGAILFQIFAVLNLFLNSFSVLEYSALNCRTEIALSHFPFYSTERKK